MKNIKKYIFLGIIIITVLFIWSNSLASGDTSMESSNSVKAMLLSLFSSVGINLENSFFIEFIRKFGHFFEYFILGAELFIYRNCYLKKTSSTMINIFYIGAITAFLDETIQLIPGLGRSAEVTDVWIDISGISSAFLIVFIISYIIKMLKKSK